MILFKPIFLLPLLFYSSAYADHPVAPFIGNLGLIEGEVFLDSRAVKKSAPLKVGDVVETKKGHATLLIGKGSVFHIGPDSKMVVNQFGMKDVKGEAQEEGELELKFGRTRALILNQGNEKKDLKIKARAATMGVRGTEIYISAPKNKREPVQFFTLEGKAEVMTAPQAKPIQVAQNQGVATSGSGAGAGSGASAPTLTVAQVKEEIRASGMQAVAPPPPGPPPMHQGSLSDTFTTIPPIYFDPVQDRLAPIQVNFHLCNAATGACP